MEDALREEYYELTQSYTEDVLAMISKIEEFHFSNTSETRLLSEQLIEIGQELKDDYLLGFAYYYLAEAHFIENRHRDFNDNLIIGLEHQLRVDAYKLLAKSYNILGIVATYASNSSIAMDYYLMGLRYATQGNEHYMAGIIHSNMANVYRTVGEIEKAITYMELALEELYQSPNITDIRRNESTIYSNLAEFYLELGDVESAHHWFKKRDGNTAKFHSDSVIAAYSFEIRYNHELNNIQIRDEQIEKIILAIEDSDSLLGVFDEIFALLELLYKIEYWESLWRLLIIIDEVLIQSELTTLLMRTLTYKIYYFQKVENSENLAKAYEEYFRLGKQLALETKTTLKNDIILREELEQIRDKNRKIQSERDILFEKSRRDFLTNLPNRSWFESYFNEALMKAKETQTILAVEVLDIDSFKGYNDILGHQEGDLYLLALSGLLHQMNDKELFCARYGGDEFVIVYENKNEEEILQIAERLRQEVMKLNIPSSKEKKEMQMTISQGIYVSFPENEDTMEDYFDLADQALYLSKQKGKNSIQLLENKKRLMES